MITRLQGEAKRSVELMEINVNDAVNTAAKSDEANRSLESIRNSVGVILDMNNQIATAAEEQTHVAADINKNVVEINDLAKTTHENSVNNASRANDLTGIAKTLNESVDKFNL